MRNIYIPTIHTFLNLINFTDVLSYKFIGINLDLMCQYIESVADYLPVSLGNDKIYNITVPFEFMDMISL